MFRKGELANTCGACSIEHLPFSELAVRTMGTSLAHGLTMPCCARHHGRSGIGKEVEGMGGMMELGIASDFVGSAFRNDNSGNPCFLHSFIA